MTVYRVEPADDALSLRPVFFSEENKAINLARELAVSHRERFRVTKEDAGGDSDLIVYVAETGMAFAPYRSDHPAGRNR